MVLVIRSRSRTGPRNLTPFGVLLVMRRLAPSATPGTVGRRYAQGVRSSEFRPLPPEQRMGWRLGRRGVAQADERDAASSRLKESAQHLLIFWPRTRGPLS